MEHTVLSTVPRAEQPESGGLYGRVRAVGRFLHNCLHRTIQISDDRGNTLLASRKRWNSSIRIAPEKALEILTRDMPSGTEVKLDFPGTGRRNDQIFMFMTCPGQFTEWRPFDVKGKSIGAGSLTVEPAAQGKGIGRAIIRNEIEFFKACGLRKFSVHAASTAGGYTWARFRFLPNNPDSADFRIETRVPLAQRFNALKDILNAEERSELEKLLPLKDPRDLWRIADMDADIGPRLKNAFNLAGRFTDYSEREAWRYISGRAAAGKKITLGQVMLAGTSWYGHIDMDNAEQMKQAGDYAGGWKYISFGLR